MAEIKKCSQCSETKDVSMFNRNTRIKCGYASQCKACKKVNRERDAEYLKTKRLKYYEDNRDFLLAQQKAYREDNIEKCKTADAAKYSRNRDRVIERVSQYQKDNPEINRKASKKYRDANLHLGAAKTARRRARLAKATPLWASDELEELFLAEIFHLAKIRTELTGVIWHVDHSVPLTSKLVCGLHCMANLQLLTAFDNISKSNRYWPDMWLDSDFNLSNNTASQPQGE